MLLFCGVNIPLATLPGWMSAISRILPLTHGIEAARKVAAGATLGDTAGLIGTELLVASCYALAGLLLFRVLERESRRSAVLDAY
jgi:ABC-2 type transport system permease protein